ncbi:hypothetical protein TERTU_0284 [Teredinibacter turnerae T7901]|uniref:Uncharacterized protein n=1 Tax=Teredinibacter turnerae (strain ATCC 39867 / T7901) TaxID=377629 RepID=C5BM34_TERTT|nr:hypothetical protein TERTU_0284 [Teredinibacter turnerae T7901]
MRLKNLLFFVLNHHLRAYINIFFSIFDLFEDLLCQIKY